MLLVLKCKLEAPRNPVLGVVSREIVSTVGAVYGVVNKLTFKNDPERRPKFFVFI